MRKLASYDPDRVATEQIKAPCSDCPWRRDALKGWLGSTKAEEWVRDAHGEARVQCHVFGNVQCAGIAVYRANVCKIPRDPDALRLPPDREQVFASPQEFLEHHREGPLSASGGSQPPKKRRQPQPAERGSTEGGAGAAAGGAASRRARPRRGR